MEYAEEDLSQILPQRALTPAEANDLLPPLLDAVAFLHGNGFVHGGLKPSNILAVGDQLKLASDHIAPALDGNSGRRRRDVYDAPETALGVVSRAGDIWSLGATLVSTLMRSARFSEDASQRDAELPPTMPEPFRGIARECLHFDPKRRSSIAEIKARLEPAGSSLPAAEPEAPAKPSVGVRQDRHTWRMLVPIGILLLFAWGVRLFLRSSASSVGGFEEPKVTAATREPAVTPNPAPVTASRPETSSNGEVVKQALPDIPQSAKNTISGTVKIAVRVEVDSTGKVTGAKLTSPGPSQYFASRALEAAEHWEFVPPSVDGQPTASSWVVHFRLRRSSIQSSAERLRRS